MNTHKITLVGCFLILLIALMVYFSISFKISNLWNDGAHTGKSKNGLSPNPTQSHYNTKSSNPVSDFISAYQTPIEFYGKVLDQYGTPIAEATIKLMPFDNVGEDSRSKMTLVSDENGRFSVKGLKGLAMGVQVTKDGYMALPDLGFEKPASSRRIEYGLTPDKGERFRHSNRPTLFTLHKIGPFEPMVYVKGKRWHLAVDGTPRNIALDSEKGVGAHQIEFRFTSDWSHLPSGKRFGKLFDWKLEARIPQGGFLQNDSYYMFDAPEAGYQEMIIVGFPSNIQTTQWKRTASCSYFVKFADGTYGRIRFSIDGASDMSPLSMTSWLSLKPGSRNLASDKWDPSVVPDK